MEGERIWNRMIGDGGIAITNRKKKEVESVIARFGDSKARGNKHLQKSERRRKKTGNLHDQIVNKLCNGEEWSNLDNFLKMIAICMKIRTDTSIILMGETECGKTSIIKFLAHVANVNLIAIDVHGGFGSDELTQIMKECNIEISRNNIMELWVFLNEVNTSPDIGWFKELIYDHSLDGNDENVNINDPLSKWVYRVFPLCETMKEYAWHFGQLSQLDEKQYIQAMVRQLKEKFDKQSSVYEKIQKWEPKITEYIVASQQFLRKHLKNEFIVSLRDVSRCLKFFHWLMQQPQTDKPVEWTERALKIALGLCYYFRLDKRKRKEYDTMMLERNQCSFVK
ncbi:hypothetical protein RFI_39874, partial [Reticulomyxa filosa]